uniref:Toll-like receptor 1 n=1 Tax=Littorina littorea TaxID=31216 RepID=A0A7G8Z9Z3_LITLI|nr:toll-like receptor 1 [Littorina littorea]
MDILFVALLSAVLVFKSAETKCDDQPLICWHTDSPFPLTPPVESCYGEGLCKCTNETADCSSSFGNLTFVPNLNRSYQYLNLSNNNLTNISHRHFFANASKDVRVIDLYNNGLTFIAEGVFKGLEKLGSLLLGGSNLLGYKDIPSLLVIPSLRNLSMSCLKLGDVPEDTFLGVTHSQLRYLDLSWNCIGSLNMSVFKPLRKLKTISLWRNEIYELATAHMPSWETLDLPTNRLYDFPRTCADYNTSLFPNLKALSLDQNMIHGIDDPVCLPKVKVLSVSYNHFLYFRTNTFRTDRFPNLQIFQIMQMENKIYGVSPFFINNSAVAQITFVLNNIDFSMDYAHPDMFGGCTGVTFLNLRGNTFQYVTDDKFHRLLKPMERSLNILSLSGTQLTHISPNMFSRLKHITELYLYENSLFSIPDGVFDNIGPMWKLILDDNMIETISETTFGVELRSRLKDVNLGGNPYHCSCEILWFQQWMRSNPTIFRDFHTRGYRCANVRNVTVPDFVLNPQACILGSNAASLTIAISCVLLFFLILFIVYFRFRWHARLCLYEVCRSRRRRSRTRRFKYDVFVSYAEEDVNWVLDELLPVLEGELGLRLCIHQRDFLPGKQIVDNIADCVTDSERVVLVFSPHFARSQWCQFELKYCQSFVMERDDVMVLVALQETQSRDMTGAMLAVLQTTTYIEWEDGQDARQSFWARLRLALDE